MADWPAIVFVDSSFLGREVGKAFIFQSVCLAMMFDMAVHPDWFELDDCVERIHLRSVLIVRMLVGVLWSASECSNRAGATSHPAYLQELSRTASSMQDKRFFSPTQRRDVHFEIPSQHVFHRLLRLHRIVAPTWNHSAVT